MCVQWISKYVCATTLCSGCVHPVQFCSDDHHHWLPEEHPDHLSGHDDRRYCLLPIYIAYILSWWLEATTSTAFSTSSGSTSASLEVLSTQKVSFRRGLLLLFSSTSLFAVTFSTKKSSPLPTTTAGGEKTWKKQTFVMNINFLQTFVISIKIWTSIHIYQRRRQTHLFMAAVWLLKSQGFL